MTVVALLDPTVFNQVAAFLAPCRIIAIEQASKAMKNLIEAGSTLCTGGPMSTMLHSLIQDYSMDCLEFGPSTLGVLPVLTRECLFKPDVARRDTDYIIEYVMDVKGGPPSDAFRSYLAEIVANMESALFPLRFQPLIKMAATCCVMVVEDPAEKAEVSNKLLHGL